MRPCGPSSLRPRCRDRRYEGPCPIVEDLGVTREISRSAGKNALPRPVDGGPKSGHLSTRSRADNPVGVGSLDDSAKASPVKWYVPAITYGDLVESGLLA